MAIALHENSIAPNDSRRVVLIKSLATNNRFYTLVTPESGIKNADTVEQIPDDLTLGIAYPCLEDGLNDFAVIRTTFETLDFFPDDEEMRKELMEIINDARGKLVRRLEELRDRIAQAKAHFLGTDLEEFKSYALDIVHRGYPRRNLDSMMKLNVFGSVAEAEGNNNGGEPLYRYEFRNHHNLPNISQKPAREFVATLIADVLDSVTDDTNYNNQLSFDRNVFQKFIALMFVNYATTDPIFYGTHRSDYGVSSDKDMDRTPLYMAISRELREIEAKLREEALVEQGLEPLEVASIGARLGDERTIQLPGTLVNEDVLLGPISSICAAAEQLSKRGETSELARVILGNASRLVEELKRLNIVSPFAYDPGVKHGKADAPD